MASVAISVEQRVHSVLLPGPQGSQLQDSCVISDTRLLLLLPLQRLLMLQHDSMLLLLPLLLLLQGSQPDADKCQMPPRAG